MSLPTRFRPEEFIRCPDDSLLRDLEVLLTARLEASANRPDEAYRLVQELKSLGHDLYSFDDSPDFQLWCGDWVHPKEPYELILAITFEPPAVVASFRERTDRRPR
jgi:hypothetical protein